MQPLRITIVLPFPVTKPVGGARIMYEYANRLQSKGHRVKVVHSLRRPFKEMRSPLWWKKWVFALRGAARPAWFPLDKKINSVIVNEISDRYLPDADIVFSTWWQMTYAISGLSPSKGKPVNLVQDFEVWGGQEESVTASYRLPVHHAVIARYLEKLLRESGAENVTYLPNAIDTAKFFISQPPPQRDPQSVLMLYSEEERKGTQYGIRALIELKEKFPSLNASLFGVYKRPADLPDWIRFYTKPSNLNGLYNEHAIFFSPSLGEGWALPPAEAMACGCAVVCTDIGGHADYALDGKTALLTASSSVADHKEKLAQLFNDSGRRIQLAMEGNRYLLENFNWNKSVATAERLFYQLVATSAPVSVSNPGDL